MAIVRSLEGKTEMLRNLPGKTKPQVSAASKLVTKYVREADKLKEAYWDFKDAVPVSSEIDSLSRREMAEVAMAALVRIASTPRTIFHSW